MTDGSEAPNRDRSNTHGAATSDSQAVWPRAEFRTDSILPDPPAGATILHDREYRVRAYRLGDDRILLQGALRDQKPPHLYVRVDPDPLTIHHMQVSLAVTFPQMEIVSVDTRFESFPNTTCPAIVDRYQQLVGLSIARGFTHKVRELFGGPRGCTHTTALLLAMGPVAMQTFWSMRSANALINGDPDPMLTYDPNDETWRAIINTCHVWDEDGEVVAAHEAGAVAIEAPVFLRKRIAELGLTFGTDPAAQ